MTFALQTLFILLVLLSCTSASKSNDANSATLVNELAALSLGQTESSKVPQIPQTTEEPIVPRPETTLEMFLNFIDYNAIDALNMGAELRSKTLNTDMKTIVVTINEKLEYFIKQGHEASIPKRIKEKLECFAKQGNDVSSIANTKDLGKLIVQRFDIAATVMTLGFLEDFNLNVASLVETASAIHAHNLLRILQACNIWPSIERFIEFLALSYKSKWYDPELWKTHPINWSNNLHAIARADNSVLLNDILTSQIPLETLSDFDIDALLDLVAEYDSLSIYQFLGPTSYEYTAHFKKLAESGSFKILRYIADTKGINLHLKDHLPPKRLPTDFTFFWMQGYCYLPPSHFLPMACECGRDDILEFYYQKNPCILKPSLDHLILAAINNHLSVLNWALNHNFVTNHSEIAKALVLNGHFEAFEQLQERLSCFAMADLLEVSNKAVERGQLHIVKWLYAKFKIVPMQKSLGDASIDMLKWIESVSPHQLGLTFAGNANLDNLKWISKNHPDLLTDSVIKSHASLLIDIEKMHWMSSQGWNASPNLLQAAHDGKVEMLKFAYEKLYIKPTKGHALSAAAQGHMEALKLIYRFDPFCIDKDIFLETIKYGHLESAKYLESILEFGGREMYFELGIAFKSGKSGLVKWAYHNYKLCQPVGIWLEDAISNGDLSIINWALEEGFILKTDERYLTSAAKNGQHQIFQLLIDFGITSTRPQVCIKLAFQSGSLDIVKYLVEKVPRSFRLLKNEELSTHNYHVWLWLQDQDLLLKEEKNRNSEKVNDIDQGECCIL